PRCGGSPDGGAGGDDRGRAAGGRAVAPPPDLMREPLIIGEDGLARCWWGGSTPDYAHYHDREWGRPVTDDRGLYERLILEAFQSGLSWITILRKREAFREVFRGFDLEAVARFGAEDVERLLTDARIVRNRAKIDAAVANA